jgi:RNA polymerase sigma-70 factor (ECF subfamily)
MLATRAHDVEADELGCPLFDAHHLRLFRLARRLSSSHDEARDLVQETFVRALRSKAGLPSDRQEQEAWLVTALVNLARDRGRRSAVRVRNAAEVRAQSGDSPEAGYVAKIAVERALERLDPRRRAVIALHELDGEPVKRIAALLGIAPVTVRWHLARARKQLATMLA